MQIVRYASTIGTHNVEEQPTRGTHGVYLFLDATEPHSSLLEALDDSDEIFEGASQAVETPDHQRVPCPAGSDGVFEAGAVCLRSGELVLVDMVGVDACCVECILLELKLLVVR